MNRTIFKAFLGLILCFGCFQKANAQAGKFWVFFTDKDSAAYNYTQHLSAECLAARTLQGVALQQYSDAPIKGEYIKAVAETKVKLRNRSKWFNAVAVEASLSEVLALKSLPFVKGVLPFQQVMQPASLNAELLKNFKKGIPYTQLLGNCELPKKLNGKGIRFGLIDAGFKEADEFRLTKDLFKSKRIKAYRDFAQPAHTATFFKNNTEGNLDRHGTRVLGFAAGYSTEEKFQEGFATEATFYLARTDEAAKEYRGEEDSWLAAMEWMDSLGVRLINTSLGYATGFDDPKENFKIEEIDGKTSLVVRAATKATVEKGIMLVVSAGNEGEKTEWKGQISTPADCPTALTVGAIDTENDLLIKAGYSSTGPLHINYIKPDVVCHSLEGTSFSAPSIAGMVAIIMQAYPSLKNTQLIDVMHRSSNLYLAPNNWVGYGLPNVCSALDIAKAMVNGKEVFAFNKTFEKMQFKKERIKIPLLEGEFFKCYSFVKQNATVVLDIEVIESDASKNYTISRKAGATHYTIITDKRIIEVEFLD